MLKIELADFRRHMAHYLVEVESGHTVMLTTDGRAIAELKPPADQREQARPLLAEIAAVAEVGDVVSPVLDGSEGW